MDIDLVLDTVCSVNFVCVKYCTQQADAFDAQFNFWVVMLKDKLPYVSVMFDTIIGFVFTNNGAHFNKCIN